MIVTAGSTEKIRRCLELGADRAVNYKTENVAAAIRDFAPQGLKLSGYHARARFRTVAAT